MYGSQSNMHKKQKLAINAEQKLQQSLSLYYAAWRLKKTALRQRYPEWSEEKIEKKIKELFLYARS